MAGTERGLWLLVLLCTEKVHCHSALLWLSSPLLYLSGNRDKFRSCDFLHIYWCWASGRPKHYPQTQPRCWTHQSSSGNISVLLVSLFSLNMLTAPFKKIRLKSGVGQRLNCHIHSSCLQLMPSFVTGQRLFWWMYGAEKVRVGGGGGLWNISVEFFPYHCWDVRGQHNSWWVGGSAWSLFSMWTQDPKSFSS